MKFDEPISQSVGKQYDAWPYPSVPLIASVRGEQVWQIHLDWMRSRCGIEPLQNTSNIWIAGCGTFQPYVIAKANPSAKILATDLADQSINVAKRRCRLHRIRNVDFSSLDLNDPGAYPNTKFDWIECYGVLMCVEKPHEVLRQLSERLSPGGILRLMVYPHYSRQRIFQIKRLANLIGLTHRESSHPLLLRKLMRSLPIDHPLRDTFFGYWDSRNLPGIVDGFLHANDTAFTGIELADMIDSAGLELGYAFHRPWGQPKLMAEKLHLLNHDPAMWLHYLDMWQSLSSNFILCLVKKDREQPKQTSLKRHPLFDLGSSHVSSRHKLRLIRMAATGARLSSRTHERSLNLSGADVRALLKGTSSNEHTAEILGSGIQEGPISLFKSTSRQQRPNAHFVPRVGSSAPNPMYDYLVDAYVFDRQLKEQQALAIPSLAQQIKHWEPLAQPLEDEWIKYGLTPYGTYRHDPKLAERIAGNFLKLPIERFDDVRLEAENTKFAEARKFLKRWGLPNSQPSEAQWRQIWILLFSYKQLTMRWN